MNRFLLFALGALLIPVAHGAGSPPKPNVVLIYIDDLGYGDLASYGCRDIPTPHLDRLASEGVRCTASYITNPPCCPSRCACRCYHCPPSRSFWAPPVSFTFYSYQANDQEQESIFTEYVNI